MEFFVWVGVLFLMVLLGWKYAHKILNKKPIDSTEHKYTRWEIEQAKTELRGYFNRKKFPKLSTEDKNEILTQLYDEINGPRPGAK